MSSAGEALLMVAPVPSVGQAGTRARGTPLEIIEPPATEVIPLSTMGQPELPLVLVAPTVVGAIMPIEAPLTQAKVAVAMMGET